MNTKTAGKTGVFFLAQKTEKTDLEKSQNRKTENPKQV